jgi:hypothetical protein
MANISFSKQEAGLGSHRNSLTKKIMSPLRGWDARKLAPHILALGTGKCHNFKEHPWVS